MNIDGNAFFQSQLVNQMVAQQQAAAVVQAQAAALQSMQMQQQMQFGNQYAQYNPYMGSDPSQVMPPASQVAQAVPTFGRPDLQPVQNQVPVQTFLQPALVRR